VRFKGYDLWRGGCRGSRRFAARLRGDRLRVFNKPDSIGGFIARSELGETGFLEELANGELLDGGKNGAFGSDRCLAELLQIDLG